jgi:predicted amidohydrolase YtcJ
MRASPASLLLENANVITCDPGKPRAEAVAVKDDLILAVGGQELKQLKGPTTRMIDCGGKTLLPGFNDAHCHIFSLVRKLFSLDLGPAKVHSIEDIKESIHRKARFIAEGTWISGTDYNEFYLAEKRHPTRLDLDEVSPHHPVILSHRSLHACVLNSLALRLAGITNEKEAPREGIIERDLETGEPNGILYEMLGYIREKIIPPNSEAELDWGVAQASQQYLSLGITSLGEATVTNDLQQWNTYRRLRGSGKIKSRLYMMTGSKGLKQFQERGWKTGYGDICLRLGGLKIILSEASGHLWPSQEELNQMVSDASRAGFQVAIHAVEGTAVEAAITALEYAQKRSPQVNRRHRIEHCSECPPELRKRLGKLKAVIVSQPPFVYYSGERYLSQVSAEKQPSLYPFNSLMNAGLVVAGSSDSPVVPNNPLMGIYAAIARRAESGQKVMAAEAVSAEQALDMYTLNAAYATFEEELKGSLSPGKVADMVMLSADPLLPPPESVQKISVEMTLVGGEVVWEKTAK